MDGSMTSPIKREWTELKAPFPWFGGKRKVADLVWQALGPVDNYIEPFAGSLAVLLGRQDDRWQTSAETVNDMDAYLANFWRALAADPEQVAHYANWPVNETDLMARHLWLINSGKERISKMESDPDFYDPKVAGWWVWGICAWIGGGWCSGEGPWQVSSGGGIEDARQRPHLGSAGQGVNRQLPHLGSAGRGVNRKRPHLGSAGRGVNRQLPHLGSAGQDSEPQAPASDLATYFQELADRLRRVRVCCGDWSRVVTTGAMTHGTVVGVFLDPPYDTDLRDGGCYNTDAEHGQISAAVRDWALANGDNPRLRIVLAGYEPEHIAFMPQSWRMHSYSAGKCYGTSTSTGTAVGNDSNRHLERLWFSPHCIKPKPVQEHPWLFPDEPQPHPAPRHPSLFDLQPPRAMV